MPNFSKPNKARPSRTKKMGLDFLGFFRPIRGFSMGYGKSKSKNGTPKPRVRSGPPLFRGGDTEKEGPISGRESSPSKDLRRHFRLSGDSPLSRFPLSWRSR